MNIQPLRPLLFPIVLLSLFILTAILLPTFETLDKAIIDTIQRFPRSWDEPLIFITRLGDVTMLIIVALLVALWELLRRNYIRSLVMVGSLIALPTFFLFKETIRRVRPVTDFVIEQGLQGYSFPSGHGTGTMAVYGMIILLAYSHLKGFWRTTIVGLSALIIAIVGFSRVYLGAHFPTDILGGWILGIVIISFLRSLSLYIAKRNPAPNSVAIKDTTESGES